MSYDINYIEDLTNCFSDHEGETIDSSVETITIKADVGFKFDRIGDRDVSQGGEWTTAEVIISKQYRSLYGMRTEAFTFLDSEKRPELFDENLWSVEIPIKEIINDMIVGDSSTLGVKIQVDTVVDDTNTGESGGDVPEVVGSTDLVTIFKGDYELLDSIGEYATTSDSFDLSKFVYTIYELPIKPPMEIVSSTEKRIKVGSFDTGINARYFVDNKFVLDLGIIEIDLEYNNVYDFKGVTCVLHVPYSTPIEIPVDYVIGHVIMIEYVVDLYNGSATVNVYSSAIESIIARVDVGLTRDIPFKTRDKEISIREIGTYNHNILNKCFMEVVRPIPYNTTSLAGHVNDVRGRLMDYVGYVRVSEIRLDCKATMNEEIQIKQLLKNGVYIK